MWKRLLLLLWLVVLLLPIVPVLAGTSVDVSVYATGLVSQGIANFTITYVSETHLRFDWGYTDNYTVIMIRGKYGQYPANIADNATTPNDGYLVYTGNATSANDTSMDFDQNPGPIYYRAWAWSPTKGWSVNPSSGWKESAIMTLIGFFIFAGIMSFLGAKSTYYILKFLAGVSWWALAMYWINSPPSTITKGSAIDTVVIVLFFIIGIAMMFMPMWYEKQTNGGVEGRFKIRWPQMLGGTSEEEENAPPAPTRSERTADYATRVNRALRGETRRRRY